MMIYEIDSVNFKHNKKALSQECFISRDILWYVKLYIYLKILLTPVEINFL